MDTKYQDGLHKQVKVTTKLKHLWSICLAFNLFPDLSGSNDHAVPCKFAQATRLALARQYVPTGHSFFNISLKKYTYLDSFIKNIFNTYTLKRYGWFSLYHFPTPQHFLHPSKKLLPAVVISLRMEEKQSMYCLKS